jgi:hypothetical protein
MNMSTMSATAVSDWPTPTVFDQHRVEAGRLDQQHGLARAPGDTAQSGAGRRRSDEGGGRRDSSSMRVLSPRIEPPPRFDEDRSPARRASGRARAATGRSVR